MLNKVRITLGVFVLALTVIWVSRLGIEADNTTPGTVNDPLVTKSFVDLKVAELKAELMALINNTEVAEDQEDAFSEEEESDVSEIDMAAVQSYIDQRLAALNLDDGVTNEETTDQPSDESEEVGYDSGLFEVVGPVAAGTRIVCGASVELILRAGGATVIAGAEGDGVADLTSGFDLTGGVEVPQQHHLLVSRDDGRGFYVTIDETYVLIKGDYTLE